MNSVGSRPQKRKHNEASSATTEGGRTAKRRKTFASGYSPDFWNTLSKVRLTRRALIEFDQRTASSRSIVSVPRTDVHTVPKRRLLRSTTKRLKQIAGHGGPDLSKLRGHSERAQTEGDMSQSSQRSLKRSNSSNPDPEGKTRRKSKTISPYSAEFEQKMIDLGVYPENYEMPDGNCPPEPDNIEQIRERLIRPRPSLSPTLAPKSVFEDFRKKSMRATSESKTLATLIPIIAGSEDQGYNSAENILFTRLEKFNEELSIPKPDIYYGAHPSKVNRRVRRDLQQSIVPSSRQHLPAAPNFFVEVKGEDGRSDVARRQAMYNGAIGARGIHQLQNYGSSSTAYDGNAYTLSATYTDGQIKIYATHPRESESHPGQTEYFTTLIDGYYMTGNAGGFRAGSTVFRNARDWTMEQRDAHIITANAAAENFSPDTTSTSRTESVSMIDEDNEEPESPPEEISLPAPTKRQRSSPNSRHVRLDDCAYPRSEAS